MRFVFRKTTPGLRTSVCLTAVSGEWLVDRRTRLRKVCRATLGHIQAVFEADAELAVDGDHRLVAEAHAGRKRRLVAAHEVGPLVAVEPDAVTGAMRQAGHLVIRAEAGVGDHLASRGVDRFARRAWLHHRERGSLRLLLEIPDLRLARRGAAEHRGARDVGLIAVDRAAAIHLDDVAFFQFLRLDAAVWKRGVFTEADRRAAGRAERAMRRGDVGAQLVLRHPFAESLKRRLERLDRDVAGFLHQRQLGGVLEHPAARRDRLGVDVLGAGRLLADAAEDEEAQALFDADAPSRGAAVLENAGDLPVRTLVFLPRSHFGVLRHQFACAGFFEAGADPRDVAAGRNHRHEG